MTPSANRCYAASEALYHLLGGQAAGIKPGCARLPIQTGPWKCHWYLTLADGKKIDPTADQFDEPFDYSKGTGKGFLTKHPSGKAQRLLDIIKERNLL
jgi:hypothetical protein